MAKLAAIAERLNGSALLGPFPAPPKEEGGVSFLVERSADADLALEVEHEISADGGATWLPWLSFTTTAGEKLDRAGNVIRASGARRDLPEDGAEWISRYHVRPSKPCDIVASVDSAPRIGARSPPQTHNSVTYDTDTEAVATAVTSVTLSSFTVASNANRCLAIGVAAWDATSADSDVSGVTWNGSSTGAAQVTNVSGPGGSINKAEIWRVLNPTATTASVVVSFGGTCSEVGVNVMSLYGVDQTTPTGTPTSGSDTGGSSVSCTVSAATDDMVYDVVYHSRLTAAVGVVGAGQTERANVDILGGAGNKILASTEPGATSVTMSWDLSTGSGAGSEAIQAAVAFKSAAAVALEQEGFRWGVDDGSESAHTWEAAQDTNITIADTQSRLLRLLVNATSDPASTAYALRYQKNGSGGYVAVPVGSSTSPTLSWGAAGTIAYSASGGTSVAPTYPSGITANSALVLVVGQKPSSANGGTVTTPSGWTLQAQNTGATDGNTGGYTTTLGTDTGNTNIYVYTKDSVTGSESGTLSVTVGTNGVCWANIYRIEASDTGTLSYAGAVGKDTSAGSVSIATGSMDIAAGDYILAGMVIPTDVTTPSQFSAEALSQSGTTFGTVTEVEEPDSTTGNDIGGFIVQAPVSSGSGSGAVTLTATAGGTTTNVRGPGFVLRVRVAGVSNECYIATSSNIAAGGEATTARLTAPSGKSTSDFVTGRRWDDENGADSIDITTDDYTEVEWLVALSSAPSTSDYFEFQVYAGSTALDTYTLTPRWTVDGGGVTLRGRLGLLGVGI